MKQVKKCPIGISFVIVSWNEIMRTSMRLLGESVANFGVFVCVVYDCFDGNRTKIIEEIE